MSAKIISTLPLDSCFTHLDGPHHSFTELYSLLFVDGNPAGVKALLNDMGFIENELRPLVGARFQELFHSSVRSAFHLSLTVLVRYRSLGSI